MQMLKFVVVLLIAGSGDARPQKNGRFHKKKKKLYDTIMYFKRDYDATETIGDI